MESLNGAPLGEQERRWQAEAAFFDAEKYAEGPIPEVAVKRYLALKKPWLAVEYPYSALGDISGKTVLEIGCGEGTNAILMGLRGARVYGIDISHRAVEIARRRAALHGITDRVEFLCTPLELFVQAQREPVDIIAGWAVLHHLLPVLEPVLLDLKKIARPDTLFLFVEPVNLWGWLRSLRLMLPIPVHGTPDERPLNPNDLAIIERQLPGLRARYDGFLARVLGPMFTGYYESMSPFQTFCLDSIARIDNVILQGLGIHGLASTLTLHGSVREPVAGPGKKGKTTAGLQL